MARTCGATPFWPSNTLEPRPQSPSAPAHEAIGTIASRAASSDLFFIYISLVSEENSGGNLTFYMPRHPPCQAKRLARDRRIAMPPSRVMFRRAQYHTNFSDTAPVHLAHD